jgi:hypothetical protein
LFYRRKLGTNLIRCRKCNGGHLQFGNHGNLATVALAARADPRTVLMRRQSPRYSDLPLARGHRSAIAKAYPVGVEQYLNPAHSRASGNPDVACSESQSWVPAFAGTSGPLSRFHARGIRARA